LQRLNIQPHLPKIPILSVKKLPWHVNKLPPGIQQERSPLPWPGQAHPSIALTHPWTSKWPACDFGQVWTCFLEELLPRCYGTPRTRLHAAGRHHRARWTGQAYNPEVG